MPPPLMELSGARICITGGGGFIGSHLADRLVADNEVVVVDTFDNGRREWVPDGADIVEGDVQDADVLRESITERTGIVFHLAADKAVDSTDPSAQFRDNTALTASVLERMDAVGCPEIVFTSSSTVYGEAPRPTPEDYAPLEPISMYGAAKLAEESLLSVYAHSHGFDVRCFRFANIVGPRLQRGAVIPDFIHKLREGPTELEILGDGRQEKSYMHISECLAAMEHVAERSQGADRGANNGVGDAETGTIETYNLGTRTTTSVRRIADIVAEEMGLDPEYSYTGGDRGWVGDVPRMRLSIEKLSAVGWTPELSSEDAVRRAVRELLCEA